jgi:hypothetical protein
MRSHENSVVAESKRARPDQPSASDRQREFWRTFWCAGINTDKRAQRSFDERHRQAALARAARDRDHTSQVVMQCTTLIIRIIGPVLVLSVTTMGMMMVHMIDFAALTEVDSHIPLILEGVLQVDADQRDNAGRLGQYKKSQEQRA